MNGIALPLPQLTDKNRAMVPAGFTLRDGTQVLLRPVLPEDRERIETGMAALSSDSRYFRFFTTAARLSEQQLRNLSEVDQHNHVAWIALDAADPKKRGLGIARFVLSREDPRIAEVAFTVIDAFQHRGLGTILLAVLYVIAQARGVEGLRAIVLGENTRVRNWLLGLGAAESLSGGEYRLDLAVQHDPAHLLRTPSGSHFRRAVEAVQALVRRLDATGGDANAANR